MNDLSEYPKIKRFLERVRDDLTELLSDNLLGVYVWGSLVTHSYKEGLSDIDALVVLRTDVDDEGLLRLSEWAAVVMREEACAEKFDAVFVTLPNLNSGDGTSSHGGIEFWKGTLQRTQNCLGDNPLVLDMIRKTGVSLYGPSAQEMVHPVSHERLVNALQKEVHELQEGIQKHFDDLGWRYYAITTLCRVLYTFQNNNYLSKKEALRWYQNNYQSHQSLILAALAYYEDDQSLIGTILPEDLHVFITEVEITL